MVLSKKKKRFLIAVVCIAAAVLAAALAADRGMGRLVVDMAKARVRALMVAAINTAVQDVLQASADYSDLVIPVQDDRGVLVLIKADTVRMNRLATDATLATQERLNGIGDQGISIPLGSALGSKVLSGFGPNIRVRIVPVGSVTAEFTSEFESTGINQTRHKIYLNVRAQVSIVIPRHAGTVEVDVPVLISESIIIGEVPQYYLNAESEDNALNLMP